MVDDSKIDHTFCNTYTLFLKIGHSLMDQNEWNVLVTKIKFPKKESSIHSEDVQEAKSSFNQLLTDIH